MKKIDRNSSVPLYIQLTEILIEQIQELEIGDQLDTEREICDKYDVSRTTTRLALDELEKNKYITKVHGKGNFVANKYIEQNLIEVYSFTEEMKRLGKIPKSKYIAFATMISDSNIAKKLKINVGEKVYYFVRLRIGDEIPMMLETTYLPHSRFSDLSLASLKGGSLYDLMRKDYNVDFDYAEQVFMPVLVNKDESNFLEVSVGMPALKIERFTYSKENLGNSIVEYSVAIARGDVFKYRISLENKK